LRAAAQGCLRRAETRGEFRLFMSVRLDRLLSLCLFQPLRRSLGGTGGFRLPVLMYHSISDGAEADVPAYYRTSTSPGTFAAQMAWLQAHGFKAVNLKTGLRMLHGEEEAREKSVVLTFDDGYRDFRTAAFPALQQYGFSATVFLVTAFSGRDPIRFKTRECLTWDDARELQQAGIEFGSHTVNHSMLVDLAWEAIDKELRVSKAEIEQRLGERVVSFAYPYAFPSSRPDFVSRLGGLLRDAGYECCATTDIGTASAASNPFAIPRLPVNGDDDAKLLQAKLDGSYDWMAAPQGWFKALKQWKRSRGAAGSRNN
jgi:peptidoglycan/xylan/chitin deacetylase (PgdA/CDA1 family)